MKTKKLLTLSFLICCKFVFGQVTFQETIYGVPDTTFHLSPYAVSYDIKETYDNGYIVTGITGFGHRFLMKLDINGDTVWTTHFLSSPTVGYSVLQTCDSGYITSGTNLSGSGMNKTDRNGNILWSKNYPSAVSPLYGTQGKVIKTNDCGYILATATDSSGAGGYDIYLIKTDTGGNPLWSRTYGGTGDDEAFAIQQTADGGYIIGGYSNSFDSSGYVAYLIKTDSNGDTLWTKAYHNGQFATSGVSYIQQTYDHGYILSGAYLIKTDSTGNVIWSKNYGGSYMQQTPDSGYIFVSGVSSFNNDGADVLLIKTNSNGNLLWARDFPGFDGGLRNGTSLVQTKDGGYAVTDYTQVTNVGNPQFYSSLNKTDANGQSGCNESNTTLSLGTASITASGTATVVTSPVTTVIASSVTLGYDTLLVSTWCTTASIPEPRTEKSPIIFPNPISPDGSLTIFLNEDLKNADLTIFTITGQPLYAEKVNGKGQMVLDALKNKLSAGMYFIRIMQGETMMVVKFVVMN